AADRLVRVGVEVDRALTVERGAVQSALAGPLARVVVAARLRHPCPGRPELGPARVGAAPGPGRHGAARLREQTERKCAHEERRHDDAPDAHASPTVPAKDSYPAGLIARGRHRPRRLIRVVYTGVRAAASSSRFTSAAQIRRAPATLRRSTFSGRSLGR